MQPTKQRLGNWGIFRNIWATREKVGTEFELVVRAQTSFVCYTPLVSSTLLYTYA
jgi:hypothetical protein